MNQNLIFRIEVQEGRGYGTGVQALVCSATFAGETKPTQFSVGRDTHLWATTLQWGITKPQLRKASSVGQNTCKVVVSTKDGNKLGWLVLDLRKAKLNSLYSDKDSAEGKP